jgi:hypothetical protein
VTLAVTDTKIAMPGRGGVRAPLRRYVKADSRWGYVIGAAHPGNGGSHHLTNFIGYPEFFEHREDERHVLNDTRQLMVEHHFANHQMEEGRYRDWKALWDLHEGEILVIASCGPSLTQSLPTLYKHRDKFRLMTLNRSHRAFMDREAKPDYHYFVERRPVKSWTHEVENNTGRAVRPLDFKGIKLITTPQAYPPMIAMFDPDKRFWGWSSLGGIGDQEPAKALTSFDVKGSTTVGNAPYIAHRMGFRKIVLVGCDFALDCRVVRTEKEILEVPRRMYFDRMWHTTHYAGSSDASRQLFCKHMNPLLGHGGKACMANAVLIGQCEYFQAVLDIIHYEGGTECVNATPRGQLMWNNMSLEEALEL